MSVCSILEDKREDLVEALRKGDVATSSSLLKEFPTLSTCHGGQPLLKIAVNASSNCTQLVGMLLKSQADVSSSDPLGVTALHYSARKSCIKCLVKLVKAGADVNQRDGEGRVPLHYAIHSRRKATGKCIRFLLYSGCSCSVSDHRGRTPLHTAAQVGNVRATKVLLESGASTLCRDINDRMPLSFASIPEVASILLNAGADVTAADTTEETVLEKAVKRKPSIVPTLMASGIAIHGDIFDSNLCVFFNLNILSSYNRGEIKIIRSMAYHRHYDFLKYPLCEVFIHLKWLKVAPLFYIKLIMFATLVMTLTADASLRSKLPLYTNITSHNETLTDGSADTYQKILTVTKSLKYFGGTLLALIILWMLLQMITLKLRYWRRFEKWLEVIFVISALFLLRLHGPLDPWERHVAAYVILIGWGNITVLIGHDPSVGIYVQMFKRVSIRMLTFACVYMSLFIGFAVSFHLVFEDEVFSTLWMSGLKTLAMMVGELDFSSILGENKKGNLPGTSQIIFVLFVLLMTVVITNLLVGLAVEDIQKLQKEAGVSRLALTVEQETSVDIMLSSKLIRCIMPHQLHTWLQNKCSLLYHLPQQNLEVPNACNQTMDSDTSVDWWIRRGTRSEQRGPMEHYNIFICPYDPVAPGKVYASNATKLIPTSYTLPEWIVRNTKLLIENGLHNKENEVDLVTSDGEGDAEEIDTTDEKPGITLENLQEQLHDLQKSVSAMSQMVKKIMNAK